MVAAAYWCFFMTLYPMKRKRDCVVTGIVTGMFCKAYSPYNIQARLYIAWVFCPSAWINSACGSLVRSTLGAALGKEMAWCPLVDAVL